MTKEEGLELINKLIEEFDNGSSTYLSDSYNEEECKQHFITPFFKALGWSTESSQYVKMEGRSKASNGRGRIDYIFKLGSRVKDRSFFVEAKKPAENTHKFKHILQAKSYAFSTGGQTPLAVLSDFETLQVWYVLKNPAKYSDNPDHDKVLPKKGLIHYKDYPKYWDDIWNLLSFESHQSGVWFNDSLQKLDKNKDDKDSLNADFIDFLLNQRIELIRHLKSKNQHLGDYELEEICQKLIDRVLFIQNAEDKGLFESQLNYKSLLELVGNTKQEDSLYQSFIKAINSNYPKYYEMFNGELFKPHDASNDVVIEDSCFKKFIESFYFPKSPYRFDVVEPEILGQIYEEFLGLRINASDKRAKVSYDEAKKEKGGVFYTPNYIIDLIVEESLAKLVAGKKLKDIKNIKIIDIACGSGAFLLGAYNYLLNYYQEQYNLDRKQGKLHQDYTLSNDGNMVYLSLAKRGQILSDHIYGIDIDISAVEITRFSLYIKTIDVENDYSRDLFTAELKKALPSLDKNICLGNALVKPSDIMDFSYDALQPFSYEEKFKEIFSQNGGFDCVIGNPPYLRVQGLTKHYEELYKTILASRYQSSRGNYDLANLFIEKGLSLLNNNGYFSYIVNAKFLNADNAEALRALLYKERALSKIIHFGANFIFKSATTYTCVFVARKEKQKAIDFYRYPLTKNLKQQVIERDFTKKLTTHSYEDIANIQDLYGGSKQWLLFNHKVEIELFKKICQNKQRVSDIFEKIYQGLATSGDKFMIGQILSENENSYQLEFDEDEEIFEVEKRFFRKMVMGKEVHRYQILEAKKAVFFPYDIVDGKGMVAEQATLKKETPQTWAYVEHYRKQFKGRERGRMNVAGEFYRYIYPKNLEIQQQPKLMSMEMATGQSNITYDESGLYHSTTVYGWVKNNNIKEDYMFYLAILNSPLCFWFMFWSGDTLSGEARRFQTGYLNPFPLPSFTAAQHDEIVKRVNQLYVKQKELKLAKSENIATPIKTMIIELERMINQLVYQLYGLSQAEIDIVENNN